MKKALIILTILMMCAIMPSFAQDEKTDMGKKLTEASENIKLLANACDLYSNEHFTEYPDPSEFYSKKFDKYILKALGVQKADTNPYYICPGAGTVKYVRYNNKKAFKISCPAPYVYKLKELYFSTEYGFVPSTEEKKTVSEEENNYVDNWTKVTTDEKEAMSIIIRDLYKAYKDRKIDDLMEIEGEAINRSADEAEKKGKYTKAEVVDAFKGTAMDLFGSPEFGVEPLDLKKITFRKKSDTYQAFSKTPIITTNQVTLGTMKVRLRIGTIHFEKIDGNFRIVKMDMY